MASVNIDFTKLGWNPVIGSDILLSDYIHSLYQPLIMDLKYDKFWKMVGKDAIKYLCDISARFALWTLGPSSRENDQKPFGVWLSLVWLIDGIYDHNKTCTISQRESLIKLISDLNDGADINTKNILEEIIVEIYTSYLKIINQQRQRNPKAFSELQNWFNRYLVLLPVCDEKLYIKPKSLQHYEARRLDDGAMMCVAWHLALFENVDIGPESSIFEFVSIIVSLHNDILSCDRDIKDKTITLVTFLRENNEDSLCSNLKAFSEAFALVNSYNREADFIFKNMIESVVLTLAKNILRGSYSWAIREERYKTGLLLSERFMNGSMTENEFDDIVLNSGTAAGDPH